MQIPLIIFQKLSSASPQPAQPVSLPPSQTSLFGMVQKRPPSRLSRRLRPLPPPCENREVDEESNDIIIPFLGRRHNIGCSSVYTGVLTCVQKCVYTCVLMCIHVCELMCRHLCTYVYTHVYTLMYTNVVWHAYTHVYTFVYTCLYTYVYTCVWTTYSVQESVMTLEHVTSGCVRILCK